MAAGLLPAVAVAGGAVLYDAPLLLLGAALLASAAGAVPVILADRSGRPDIAAPGALTALCGLVLLLAVTANGGRGAAAGLSDVAAATAHLLSYAPPFPTRVDTLVPPVVLIWAAAFTAAGVAVRGRRLLATAPAVIVLVGTLLLVGRSAPVPGWVTPAIGIGVFLLLLEVRPAGTRRVVGSGRRFPVFTVAGVAVLLALGSLLAVAVPDGDRADARSRYRPPEERPRPVDPLTRLAGWAKDGSETPLVTVRTDAVGADRPVPTAWRWAVLDRFDGARWSSSARYRPTGRRLGAAGPGSGLVQVSSTVNQTAVLLPWLPTPGDVRQVHGIDVAVSGDQDTMVPAAAVRGDGFGYSLTADAAVLDPLDAADRERIRQLTAEPSAPADVAAPGLPQRMRSYADRLAPRGAASDGARALILQDFLRDGQFVADAPPGHLYVRLAGEGQFLDDRSVASYLKGTSEQFATAFALLARAAGLPSRVVVGFTLPGQPAGTAVGVPASRMQAWPEVRFSGQGWVRFAPTPPDEGARTPRTPPKLQDLPPPPPPPPEPRAKSSSGPASTEKPAPGGGQAAAAPSRAPAVLATTGAALLMLALVYAAAVIVLRLRQRRARRRTEPAAGVLGAWRELEDALYLAGGGRGGGTASDVVTAVRSRSAAVSDDGLRTMTSLANAAAFGPAGSLTAHEASAAWRHSDATVRMLRREASRARRFAWWLRVAPLRRR
jgi:hypothetical protein